MSQKSTEFEQWLVLRFPSREYEEVEPEPEKPSASDRDVGGGPNDPDSIRSKCVAPAVLLLLPRLGGGGGNRTRLQRKALKCAFQHSG
jgi:hypothetical protein